MPENNARLAIDQNARNRFEKELKGFAGIYALSEMFFTAKSINTHLMEFRNRRRGPLDHHRARAFSAVEDLPKGEKAVLAAHLAIDERGYSGTAAPGEVVGAFVESVTGGRCKERTYRRHKSALIRRGFLAESKVSTGTRVFEEGKGWVSRTIRKVFLTPISRLLVAKSPTSDHVSRPRPKWPPTEGDNTNQGDVTTFPLVGDSDETTESTQRVRDKGAAEVSPSGDGSTCPPVSGTPTDGEQRALRSAPRKAASRSAAAVPPASARKNRTKIPKTYAAARRDLLRTLFDAYHCDDIFDALYFAAREQTHPHYPAAYKTALEWEPILWRWLDLKWSEKRRCLKNEVLPPLRAHVAHFTPPDLRLLERPDIPEEQKDQVRAELRQYEENAQWAKVLPEQLPQRIPPEVRELLEKNRRSLNDMAVMLHRGVVSCKDLTTEQHKLLSLCENFFA